MKRNRADADADADAHKKTRTVAPAPYEAAVDSELRSHVHQLTLMVQQQQQEIELLKESLQAMTQTMCSAFTGTRQKFSEIENYLYTASTLSSSVTGNPQVPNLDIYF